MAFESRAGRNNERTTRETPRRENLLEEAGLNEHGSTLDKDALSAGRHVTRERPVGRPPRG